MLRPSYDIKLGNHNISSGAPQLLMSLRMLSSKTGGADEAVILIGNTSGLTLEKGRDVEVKLGWDDDTSLVFSGLIEAMDNGIDTIKVLCAGKKITLMQSRTNQTFLNQNAGEIISTLAAGVNLETGDIEDGINLPVYLADSACTVYEHCSALADRCGFDLYTNEEGKLVFSRFSRTMADHTFRYGKDILAVSVEKNDPLEAVDVFPESPASSSGDETASWIIKDSSPHKGKGGSGSAAWLISDPLLKTKEAAVSYARARVYFSRRDAVHGQLELMGAAQIKLGDSVALENIPGSDANGVYQVMAVGHTINHRSGFRTCLSLGGMP